MHSFFHNCWYEHVCFMRYLKVKPQQQQFKILQQCIKFPCKTLVCGGFTLKACYNNVYRQLYYQLFLNGYLQKLSKNQCHERVKYGCNRNQNYRMCQQNTNFPFCEQTLLFYAQFKCNVKNKTETEKQKKKEIKSFNFYKQLIQLDRISGGGGVNDRVFETAELNLNNLFLKILVKFIFRFFSNFSNQPACKNKFPMKTRASCHKCFLYFFVSIENHKSEVKQVYVCIYELKKVGINN